MSSKNTLNILQKNMTNEFLYKVFDSCIKGKYYVKIFMVTAVWS